jgi:hypothetical protein
LDLAWNTVVVEPLLYCEGRDLAVMHSRHCRLAAAAWGEIAAAQPGKSYSRDYVRGFRDGFADYLDAGGTGEPPTLPPRRYWRSGYRTAEGYQAIEDWFAGFRHGARCARDSGLRHFAVIPSSLSAMHPAAQVPVQGPAAFPQEVIPVPPPVAPGSATAEPPWPTSPRPASKPRQEGPAPPDAPTEP